MERTLQIKDFLDFDKLFNKFKMEILEKHAEGRLVSEELVQTFQKLYTTIDQLLARVGRRMVAAAQGGHSSLELEVLQSSIARMQALFESQFVGGDEDKPAKLFESLDQMKSEVISSNNLNAESIASQISAFANKIDILTSLIKKKDGDIAALTKNLKESDENYKQASLKLSKLEAELREAKEMLMKPHPKPAPEESKTQEEAKVPIPQPVLPVPNLEVDSSRYFGTSKTLRTLAHRKMVIKFVRDQFPRARFQRIYDAATHGWKANDFHRQCDKKGWTLTIFETTEDFIFGGFTTAEWESLPFPGILKPCPHSFLFSVNEGSKYPITRGGTGAI